MKACHLKLFIRTKVLSPEETKAVSAAVQLASPYEVAEAAMRRQPVKSPESHVARSHVARNRSDVARNSLSCRPKS